jgi:ABC-type transport system involved in multi-copper enzyme maturation permease subunit
MRQTLAIFLDAYRELNSRKLFWVVLAITLAVVVALALPSNNDRGLSIFGLTVDFPFLSTKAISPKGFYVQLFSNIGINVWLTWGATILALISTAGMIPELISGGSVDLLLSKPIGRLRLFLTKYAAGLLFVGLQAAVFILGAFLVIGIRGHAWRPAVFLAVPIVLAFYSYLFCICALIGMLTRSTLFALLGTIIVWLGLFSIGTVETVLLDQRVGAEKELRTTQGQVTSLDRAIETVDTQLESLRKTAPAPSAPDPTPETEPSNGSTQATPTKPSAPDKAADSVRPSVRNGPFADAIRRKSLATSTKSLMSAIADANNLDALTTRRADLAHQRESLTRELEPLQRSIDTTKKWHRWFYFGKTFLPKTAETTALFERYVVDPADREGMFAMMEEQQRLADSHAKDTDEAIRARSLWWVLGTSLGFEAAMLGIAAWIFCRRDF